MYATLRSCPVHWEYIRDPRNAPDLHHCHQRGSNNVIAQGAADAASIYAALIANVIRPRAITTLSRDAESRPHAGK